ncbi:MAG: hypothetical protein WCO17_13240, partial [Betaproteobacteria bacterium]
SADKVNDSLGKHLPNYKRLRFCKLHFDPSVPLFCLRPLGSPKKQEAGQCPASCSGEPGWFYLAVVLS